MVTYINTKNELEELTEWAEKDEYLEVADTISTMSYIQKKWNQLRSSGRMEKPSTGLLTIIYFTMLYDVTLFVTIWYAFVYLVLFGMFQNNLVYFGIFWYVLVCLGLFGMFWYVLVSFGMFC